MSAHGPVEGVREVEPGLVVADSITIVPRGRGSCVVCGSHGGAVAAGIGIRLGVRAAIFNDAGIGKERAGVAGLELAEASGRPAAAVPHDTARIGDGEDHLRSGVISTVNDRAAQMGVLVGMTASAAARVLLTALSGEGSPGPRQPATNVDEREPAEVEGGIFVIDSVSQMNVGMAGAVVLTGSHGSVVAGHAVKAPVSAAIFNDAGIGKDRAGLGRLSTLELASTPAATVSADSARIGDGLDTWRSGLISHANPSALRLGVTPGRPAAEAARILRDRKA